MNRKASVSGADKSLKIGAIAFLLPLMIFLFLSLVSVSRTSVRPSGLNEELLAARITNECFSYYDWQIDRHYPGVIDLEKFNEKRLEECYFAEKGVQEALKIKLSYEDNKNKETKILETKNWVIGEQFKKIKKPVVVRIKDKESSMDTRLVNGIITIFYTS